MELDQPVFLKTVQKLANVTLNDVGTDTEFAADFLDYFVFGPPTL